MGDYILKEIDKIGVLLRGLLRKLQLLKNNHEEEIGVTTTKVELADKLGVDMDSLLAEPDFVETLVEEHGFDAPSLELFAEVLADLAFAAEDKSDQRRFAAAACEIYKYQDAHKADSSFNRYYILKQLARLDCEK